MNPHLEHPFVWPDYPDSFIAAARDAFEAIRKAARCPT
jgi:hypothetical protein